MADAQAQLRQLVARGFQFTHPTGPDGALEAVVGVRVHDNVVDMVRLHAEDDVAARRVPSDEPDVLEPTVVLWQSAGDVDTVLNELLSLPDGPSAGAR